MGMSASQGRFLQLTDRKNTIGYELQRLSNDKVELSRDMQKVSKKYQNALSSKKIKVSTNNGLTYSDISYGTLMRPSLVNGNKPILLSDSSGRIVVDDKYKKYAEMISSDGSAGGNYSDEVRDKILAELVGITDEQLSADSTTSDLVATKKQALEDARSARDEIIGQCQEYTTDQFIKKYIDVSGIQAPVTASNFAQNAQIIENAVSSKNYFSQDVFSTFKTSLDEQGKTLNDEYKIETADEFVQMAIELLMTAAGGCDTMTVMADKNGNSLLSSYETAVETCKNAEAEYNAAVGQNAQVYTASEDKQIAFYDELFTAIAELGWKHDDGIEDNEYIGQMLQNNSYYITTMTKNVYYDESQGLDERNYEYSFEMDPATNHTNIFLVNDADARADALVEYEYEKGIINAKESRIDTRMRNLETEQSAIQKMLESINKVENDNIERTFSIFT